MCTAVYASPILAQREALWRHLSGLRSDIVIPWLLVGDMNEILHPSEVRGGEFVASRAARFATLLEECCLVDLGAVGGNYTLFWKNNNIIVLSKRLDRALGDIDWRLAFPDAYVEVLHQKLLRGVQRELDARITSDMVRFEAELQIEYGDILKQEELLRFQKARENRVRFGDRNTSYFHSHTIIRSRRNCIHRLKLLSDGDWHVEEDVLVREVQFYFQNLFANDPNIGDHRLHHDAFPSLSEVNRNKLMVPVTKEEVRHALMSMKPFTAPGPDGFQPFFSKSIGNSLGMTFGR
ncbi:uncharacterized protein LOC130719279 [Lotus japonicus]|uniref:uncharacterized protein LOC130719279 n=1 Tax=Lotus japonicus TaxID=34305 RepID=UPI00258EB861|nr:uncharacterized protein LOC130719279 [Lotus japonicus]